MNRDYSYSYRWDREYCYPESNVLINKLNIQDADALHIAEREITSLRLAAAKLQPIKGKLDMKHLQKFMRMSLAIFMLGLGKHAM